MMITVSNLVGIKGLPATAMGLRKWLYRNEVLLLQDGKRFTFNLSDLPEPVRVAYATRQIEAAGLPIGTYDEAAHAAFATMPPTMRAKAERTAEIARFLMTAAQGLTGRQRHAMVRAKFSAPAMAWNANNRLICEGIKPVKRGAYGSVDGVRDAQRNRKAAREASNRAAEANNYLADAEFKAAMAAIPTPEPVLPTDAPLVAGRFGGSLQTRRKPKPEADQATVITAEMRRNLDAHLADIEAGRKPKLA